MQQSSAGVRVSTEHDSALGITHEDTALTIQSKPKSGSVAADILSNAPESKANSSVQKRAKKNLRAAIVKYSSAPTSEKEQVELGLRFQYAGQYQNAIRCFIAAGAYGKYELACCYLETFLHEQNPQLLVKAVVALESLLQVKKYKNDPSRIRLWMEHFFTDFLEYIKSFPAAIKSILVLIGSFGTRAPELVATLAATECPHGNHQENSCPTCIKATVELARCYLYENGTPARENLAIWLLEKAQTEYFPAANVELAVCYRDGIGVKKNPREAARLFRLHHKVDLRAQYLLGNCLVNEVGSAKEERRGRELMANAQESGYQPRTLYSCDDYIVALAHKKLRIDSKARKPTQNEFNDTSKKDSQKTSRSPTVSNQTRHAIKVCGTMLTSIGWYALFPFKVSASALMTLGQGIRNRCCPPQVKEIDEQDLESWGEFNAPQQKVKSVVRNKSIAKGRTTSAVAHKNTSSSNLSRSLMSPNRIHTKPLLSEQTSNSDDGWEVQGRKRKGMGKQAEQKQAKLSSKPGTGVADQVLTPPGLSSSNSVTEDQGNKSKGITSLSIRATHQPLNPVSPGGVSDSLGVKKSPGSKAMKSSIKSISRLRYDAPAFVPGGQVGTGDTSAAVSVASPASPRLH